MSRSIGLLFSFHLLFIKKWWLRGVSLLTKKKWKFSIRFACIKVSALVGFEAVHIWRSLNSLSLYPWLGSIRSCDNTNFLRLEFEITFWHYLCHFHCTVIGTITYRFRFSLVCYKFDIFNLIVLNFNEVPYEHTYINQHQHFIFLS